jgi:phage baseplate assembly protein W
MTPDFVGKGWAFPLSVDPTGSIGLAGGRQKLEQSMRLVLGTAFGERPMRPEFGCGIHDFVFAAMNVTTFGRIAHEVRSSLARWETRVEVVDVAVYPDQDRDGTLFIDVHYSEKGMNDVRNLVFPFYLIPDAGEHESGVVPTQLSETELMRAGD